MTISASIIFSFLAMICWGAGDFFIQKTVRKIGDFKALIWINFLGGLMLTPFVVKDFPVIFQGWNLVSLIILSLIQLVYGLFLFKAYKKGKLSVIEVVMIGELPLTIVLGLIFFGEKLNGLQLLIILMILVGIFLVSKTRPTWREKLRNLLKGKKFLWEKGVLMAVFAVLFSSAYNFFTALNSREISAFTAVWFPWLLSSIILLIYLFYKENFSNFLKESKPFSKIILSASVLDTLGWLFFALAVVSEDLSIITAIVSGYAVVSMFLGVRFNKEKISSWQYLGAVLVLLGAVIISVLP